MEYPLLKSALWTLVGLMLQISLTQPGRKPSRKDEIQDEGLLMRLIIHYGVPISHGLTWYMTFVEIVYIYSSWFRRITSFPSSSHAATIDTPFLAAFILLAASFLLRIYSFHILGDLFTFDVTIRPDHKLITHGPYRFVRHPSYTGWFGVFLGSAILYFPVTKTWEIKRAFWAWMLFGSATSWKIFLRTYYEDEMLRGRFGKEWVSYRERVRYRFIPGIL